MTTNYPVISLKLEGNPQNGVVSDVDPSCVAFGTVEVEFDYESVDDLLTTAKSFMDAYAFGMGLRAEKQRAEREEAINAVAYEFFTAPVSGLTNQERSAVYAIHELRSAKK